MSTIIRIIDGIPRIVADEWEVLRPESAVASAHAYQIVPLAQFSSALDQGVASDIRAVWISPENDFEPLIAHLLSLEIIAVDFPSFRDGRGYSIATLLRTRYGWAGQLRAIGDVLRDQLNFMRRCGFDAFAIRPDKDIQDAIKSFGHYSVRYQGAADDPLPLFRRR